MEKQRINDVLETFDHHVPGPNQIERITNVRQAAKKFAAAVWVNAPESADRTCAIRKIHEAMMTANKSIVLEYPDDL